MIANSKILSLLYNNLEKKVYNTSIVFAIIFTLYQLIPWEETRKLILAMDDLIKLVLKCLKSDNSKIIFVSLNFLEIVQLYDPKWAESIKRKKFKINNREFLKFIKTITPSLEMLNNMNMKNGLGVDIEDEEEYEEEYEAEEQENEYDEGFEF